VRSYRDEPVSDALVEEVIKAGTWAPTGMNAQPWRFIVVEDKKIIKYVSEETKKALIAALPGMKEQFSTDRDIICYNAPVLIFICTPKDPRWGRVRLLDSVLAAENMFLKAYDLGLGSCYMGYVDFVSEEVLKKAGVPDGYDMQVSLIIGHPKTKQHAGKRNTPDIRWIK
jgi:nitroreductase